MASPTSSTCASGFYAAWLSPQKLSENLFYHQGQLDSAIIYENRAYAIFQEKLPDDHPYLKISEDNFAFLYPKRAAQRRLTGQYQLAIEDYLQALNYSSEEGMLHFQLGVSYLKIDSFQNAITHYQLSYRARGITLHQYLSSVSLAFSKLGRLSEAENCLMQLEQMMPDNDLPYRSWCLFYSLKGELDTALDNLEKAIQLGYDNWEWLRNEAALDPLRDHPRFQALLEQAPDTKE